MSRIAANALVEAVRGATWEDYWDYYDEDTGAPIDLTGYQARMQVRAEDFAYGTTGAETVLLEALSTGATQRLFLEAAPGSTVPNRVRIRVQAADMLPLNPDNERRVRRSYGIELYIPAGINPEYVLPYAQGPLVVHGERVR